MIDPKIKEAYNRSESYPDGTDWPNLASAYVQAEARARLAEFRLDHDSDAMACGCFDEANNLPNQRHAWTLADWEIEVRQELSK